MTFSLYASDRTNLTLFVHHPYDGGAFRQSAMENRGRRKQNEGWQQMKNLRVFTTATVLLVWGLGGCKAPAVKSEARPGDVTETRVASEAAAGMNWLLNGRTFDEAHFSPLKQITDKNVNGLGLAWYLDFDGAMGVVEEPIVVDGVIYVSAPQSRIYAVDAVTGKLIW